MFLLSSVAFLNVSNIHDRKHLPSSLSRVLCVLRAFHNNNLWYEFMFFPMEFFSKWVCKLWNTSLLKVPIKAFLYFSWHSCVKGLRTKKNISSHFANYWPGHKVIESFGPVKNWQSSCITFVYEQPWAQNSSAASIIKSKTQTEWITRDINGHRSAERRSSLIFHTDWISRWLERKYISRAAHQFPKHNTLL